MLDGAHKIGFKKTDCCEHSAYVLDVTSTETITETSDKVEVVKDIFDNYETSDNNKEVFGLKTLSPAKLLQNKEHLDPEIKEKYPLAREFGVYIHKLFEKTLLDEKFDKFDYWCSLVESVKSETKTQWYSKANEHFEKSYSAIEFKKVLDEAENLWVEQNIIHANKDNELVRGTIDLLIKRKDGSYAIIDYKTTPEANYSDDLVGLAKSHKYHKQLNAYKAAITEILDINEIDTFVYFTYKSKLIKL